MITAPHGALQLGGLLSLPGIVGTVVVILAVILVARVVLKIAWKVALVALAVALVLWVVGMLGPVTRMFGVAG